MVNNLGSDVESFLQECSTQELVRVGVLLGIRQQVGIDEWNGLIAPSEATERLSDLHQELLEAVRDVAAKKEGALEILRAQAELKKCST